MAKADLSRLTSDQMRLALRIEQEQEDRRAQRLFFEIYPDEDTVWTGPTILGGLIQPGQTLYARKKYPKHIACLAACRGAAAQYDDWAVPPNLWGAIIADPGQLKSPALAEVTSGAPRLAR